MKAANSSILNEYMHQQLFDAIAHLVLLLFFKQVYSEYFKLICMLKFLIIYMLFTTLGYFDSGKFSHLTLLNCRKVKY